MNSAMQGNDEISGQNSHLATGDWQMLDPRQIPLDQIASLISTALVGIAMALGLFIGGLTIGSSGWLLFFCAVATLSVVILLIAAVYWPPLEYRYAKWRLDEIGLEIQRGVLWRHQTSVPLTRVQHADVSQGPLQRHFELGTLTVHTAGTQNASVMLTGLKHSTAIQLRDIVIRQRKAIDVV